MNKGLEALTTLEELQEVKAVGKKQKKEAVKLQRTFNQSDFKGGFVKYWRVKTVGHRFYDSDLSIEGLKEWGII